MNLKPSCHMRKTIQITEWYSREMKKFTGNNNLEHTVTRYFFTKRKNPF